MPFFKDLRRRSKASFHNDSSSNDSGESGRPSTKSTSTLNTVSTVQTPLSHSLSSLSISKLNGSQGQFATPPPVGTPPAGSTRPPIISANSSKRYSMTGSIHSATPVSTAKIPESAYAPKVLSVSQNSWVHTKVFLVYGQAGGQDQRPLDGSLTVVHHQNSFPPTNWQVCGSHFKALIHLNPGPNEIRLEFSSPKLRDHNASATVHASNFRINYLPLTTAPPLHLVILMGKDSPGTFDSMPEKIEKEGNGLQTAIRKYRMAAHLWSAFTAENMYRNGFGRRSFRFEEEWQEGTLSKRDMESNQMRSEAKVHVVRSKKTVAEIRDLNVAQQWEPAQQKGDLWGWALDDMADYFKPSPGVIQNCAVLLLDSHWDTQNKVIRGHAALGGSGGGIGLAIFGSHALHTYPSCLEDVVPAMTDCTKTNTDFVASDCGDDSSQHWQAMCIGIGAHLHEVGHVFGCPHQSKGVMLRDYGMLNRTFLTKEPYSTKTRQPGLQPCLPEHECSWHRLDALRFRSHPCFKLVTDQLTCSEDGIQVWAIDQGRLFITAKSGVSFIEIRTEGEEFCDTWIEYTEGSEGYPKQVMLTESDVRNRLPSGLRTRKVKLDIFSHAGGKLELQDINKAVAKIKLPKGATGWLGPKFGHGNQPGTKSQSLIFPHSWDQKMMLVGVKIYYGMAVDGLEFVYENNTSHLFGKIGPNEHMFTLDTRQAETISGFYVRAGVWLDGVEILTSLGRRSGVFGNATGGSGQTLMPPRGYKIAGISGSCGPFVDSFGLIIMR